MKYLSAILLVLGCHLANARPHATFTPELKKAFRYIVELRFGEAHEIVRRQETKDPENTVPEYLEGALLSLELFINEDEKGFDRNKTRFDEIIKEVETLPAEEPYRELFLGELYVAQAILNVKFDNKIPAAWQFYKCYGHLTSNYRRFPDFLPNHIPLGVLYAGIGSLPEDYKSMASLLGFEGNLTEGLAMLKKAYYNLAIDPQMDFYKPYAGFVYAYASFHLNPNEVISPDNIGLDTERSSFLLFLQAQVELETGNPAKAVEWLDRRPKGEKYFDFHYLDYLQGKILLGLEPDRAVVYLNKYLKQQRDPAYKKSTYRYLSWYHLLQGNEEKAEEMREMIFKEGDVITGADRQALREAGEPFNKTLIEARVLFDAAKYSEAQKTLEDNPVGKCCKTNDEKVEYHYRMGRILEEQNRKAAALESFKKALAVEGAPSTYALGNSTLQVGLIYEQQGQMGKAKEYFRKTLALKDYPFYEGIHQKAKAGLARIGKSY